MSRTVVIGAGAVGLLCAYELHRRGTEVVVVEKRRPGWACSAGNLGLIVPSLSAPVPAPGLVARSVRWMLSADSPLYIRPAAIPHLAPWLWRFWRHCNHRHHARGFEAVAGLNRETMRLFDGLEAAGVSFEMHRRGLLYPFFSRHTMEKYLADARRMERFGYEPPGRLGRDELLDLEPGLAPGVVGGFWIAEERHVRPESLAAGVAGHLRAQGVTMLEDTEVTGFQFRRGRAVAVETGAGSVEGDRFLVTAGAWSTRLAGQTGYRLPLEAGKGYSVTVSSPSWKPTHPLYFAEAKAACAPFGGAVRFGGTMELSGLNLELDLRRITAMKRGVSRFLRRWPEGADEQAWVGTRPVTADGLPVIGRIPGHANLYIATGHGILGITLAPVTATAVAGLMLHGTSPLDLAPFDPARFA